MPVRIDIAFSKLTRDEFLLAATVQNLRRMVKRLSGQQLVPA